MILLAALLAGARPAETSRQFMTRLYAHYRDPNYSPFAHAERVFAPQLRAAIAQDSRLADGEVGYLDGDPVCQCQDSGGMRASVTGVTQAGRDKAVVSVRIGWAHDKARPARFTLVRTTRGWRIADIWSTDEPSLLHALEKSNQAAKKR